jgi:AcrR family transcriptional regulator
MASRRGNSASDRLAATLDSHAAGGPRDVVRRAPFADSPNVGARGQRTQQRILDAALEVFAETGYDACSVDPIAKRAGCSRAAFYQYFSSKEDVFRHLSGSVARQLDAATEALGPLTPTAAGWSALRGWIARHSEIYARYEPVFHAFQAASESDDAVASGSARWGRRSVARIRARLAGAALEPREPEAVILSLLECVTRTHDVAGILRSAAPGHYAEERVGDAIADVMHRTLFGLDAAVNVHAPAPRRPPVLRFDPVVRSAFAEGEPPRDLTPARRRTWDALVDAGRRAFVERGYHRTRVEDVADAAGVSRAAFYRYFENKDALARALTTGAMSTVSRVLAELPAAAAVPGEAGRAALVGWLRRYNRTHAGEAALLRVWVDAALQDATLRASTAPALDWGRRALFPLLAERGFGDVDTECVVLIAHLSAFGARSRTPAEVGAAARVIGAGLLGNGTRSSRA